MTKLQRFDKRALAFIEYFRIAVEHLSLFPIGSELERIEYVMHELAHAFTMGFLQMPKLLPQAIETTLGRYSVATQDQLEIDTSFVTYRAMVKLGLASASDERKFAEKCAEALETGQYQNRIYAVLDALDVRSGDDALEDAVSHLVSMMRAPLKEAMATYSLPDDPADSQPKRAGQRPS
jgi:hypothetical protein